MNNEGLGSWTARRARKTPRRTAIVSGDNEYTYADLHDRVLRLAHALRGLGVRRGDRVAYLGPNHPSFLETLFAAGQLGAVFVPLNARLSPPELRYMLDDSGSSVLIHAPDVDFDLTRIQVGQSYEDLLAGAPAEPLDEPVSLDDVCLIMYTSGTTGQPKGATLTHGNLTWNCVNVLVDADLASDEVALVTAPLFHIAGLNMLCLPILLKGGTAVLEPSFNPERALSLISGRRVTVTFGVPTMYDALAALPGWDSADLSSLRLLLCGGAPVPEATIRTYLKRGFAFVQGYGMTEAAPGVLLLDREHVASKPGSAGVPHFFTDVRLDNGEIVVAGPNVMPGYWNQPPLSDGWFRSGDVARVDDDGFMYIVDRVKDMIISGGENIYPAEVENALYEHPAVAECAVIGVPDQRWGEVGEAIVVLRPGATATGQELLDSLNGRLARYKIPKYVRFVDRLPRSGAGKVLKQQLRQHRQDRPNC